MQRIAVLFSIVTPLLLGSLLTASVVSASQISQISQVSQTSQTMVRLGVLPAADAMILHVATDEGLFAAQGLAVELIPFQSALEMGAAMRANELDGHFGDIINVLTQHTSGAPQAIVATTSRSTTRQRHFGLMVSPQSQAWTLTDLKDKDIAASSATIIDFLLDAMLEEQQVPADFMVRQEIRQIPVRLQMLMSDGVEAALLPEPLVSLLESRGARTLLDDRTLNLPLAVVAISAATIAASPELPARFRAALTEAARRVNAAPDYYKTFMVKKKLLPADAAHHYQMLSFDLEQTPAGLPSEADIELFAAWMYSRNLLKTPVVPADVLAR